MINDKCNLKSPLPISILTRTPHHASTTLLLWRKVWPLMLFLSIFWFLKDLLFLPHCTFKQHYRKNIFLNCFRFVACPSWKPALGSRWSSFPWPTLYPTAKTFLRSRPSTSSWLTTSSTSWGRSSRWSRIWWEPWMSRPWQDLNFRTSIITSG